MTLSTADNSNCSAPKINSRKLPLLCVAKSTDPCGPLRIGIRWETQKKWRKNIDPRYIWHGYWNQHNIKAFQKKKFLQSFELKKDSSLQEWSRFVFNKYTSPLNSNTALDRSLKFNLSEAPFTAHAKNFSIESGRSLRAVSAVKSCSRRVLHLKTRYPALLSDIGDKIGSRNLQWTLWNHSSLRSYWIQSSPISWHISQYQHGLLHSTVSFLADTYASCACLPIADVVPVASASSAAPENQQLFWSWRNRQHKGRKKFITRKWHSESADPAKALDLSLAKQTDKQTNKQTNKKFCPHRGSNSRPSRF